MRIVLTCNFSPWSAYSGGGQRSTHNLATALAERGHDITVVFTKGLGEAVETPSDLRYAIAWASMPWPRSRRDAPGRPLVALSVARRVLERWTPDMVVHAQGEEAVLLPMLRRRRRFGLVVTPRFPSLPEVWLDPSATRLARWTAALRDPKDVALGATLRGADVCSPPSHFGAELIRRAYALNPERIEPVHNGVPAEFLGYSWSPMPGDEPDDRPVVFFGRLDDSKGVDTIIDALARLGAAAPPRVHVYGTGPRRSAYARRAAEAGLARHVAFEFKGWADHHVLGRALANASLCLLPSREENFSLAVLSAMAVGTPLVTTPVGGTPEVIDDGVHGRLVPAGDHEALAKAIGEFRRDPPVARRMAETGRRRVRDEFTWDATVRRFETIYRRLVR